MGKLIEHRGEFYKIDMIGPRQGNDILIRAQHTTREKTILLWVNVSRVEV